jgi:hypothetical protein
MPLNLPPPTIQKRSTQSLSSTHLPSSPSSGAGSRCAVLFAPFVAKRCIPSRVCLCWLALRPGSMRAPATRYTSLAPILVQPSSSSWTQTRFRKSTEAHSHLHLRMSLSSMTLRANFLALPRFPVGQLSSWMAMLSGPRASLGHQIYRTGHHKHMRYMYHRRIGLFSSFESWSIYHYYNPSTARIWKAQQENNK